MMSSKNSHENRKTSTGRGPHFWTNAGGGAKKAGQPPLSGLYKAKTERRSSPGPGATKTEHHAAELAAMKAKQQFPGKMATVQKGPRPSAGYGDPWAAHESAAASTCARARPQPERTRYWQGTAASATEAATVQDSMGRELLLLVLKLSFIVLLLFLLEQFFFGVLRYNAVDMNPSLKEGDFIVYYRLDKRYKASDLAVLNYEGKKQVQRVIAVAGDMVDITEDGLMINGHLQIEKDIHAPTKVFEHGASFPLVLKEGEIFVLGDKRDGATDSRIYGPVKAKDTSGKVVLFARRRSF